MRAALTALLLAACVRVPAGPPGAGGVVVLVPDAVWTGNPGSPRAQALALRGGKVVLAGALPQVLQAAGAAATVERLPGATIVPGLASAHLELAELGASLAAKAGGPRSRQVELKLAVEHCLAQGLTAVQATLDLEAFSILQQWDAAGVLPLRLDARVDGVAPTHAELLERGRFQGRLLRQDAVSFSLAAAARAGLETPTLAARAKAFAEAGFRVEVVGEASAAAPILRPLAADGRHRLVAASLGAQWRPEAVTLVPSERGLSLESPVGQLALGGSSEPLALLAAARAPGAGLGPAQALTAMTAGVAWAERAEDRRGELAPGYDADLTVLSVDPLSAEVTEAEPRVLLTVVAGVDVYRAPELR